MLTHFEAKINFSHFFWGGVCVERSSLTRATTYESPHHYFLRQNRRWVRCSRSLAGGSRLQHPIALTWVSLVQRRARSSGGDVIKIVANGNLCWVISSLAFICLITLSSTIGASMPAPQSLIQMLKSLELFWIIMKHFGRKSHSTLGHFNTNEHFLTHSSVILHQVQHRWGNLSP